MTIKLPREYVRALRHVITTIHWLGAAWVVTRMMERVYPRLRLFLVVAVSIFMPVDTWLFAARRYFAALRACEDEAGEDEAGDDEAGKQSARPPPDTSVKDVELGIMSNYRPFFNPLSANKKKRN